MRNKLENSYSKIFLELRKINRFYNPDSPNIYPTATSCDFESAILKTLDSLFPNSVRRKCVFHWKQIINRMTQTVFGKAVYSSEYKYVRKILHAIPVLPLHVPQVKFVLVNHLEFLVIWSPLPQSCLPSDDPRRAKTIFIYLPSLQFHAGRALSCHIEWPHRLYVISL